MTSVSPRFELTRAVTLREGASPIPVWWPHHAQSAIMAGMAAATTERGFANVRVDDVIEAARASRRTFYAHFDNREDCLQRTHQAILADCLLAVDEGPQELEPALSRLMRYLAAWPTHAHLLLIEILGGGPAAVRQHEAAMDVLARRLAVCAIPGQPLGIVSTEALLQARFGALHRLVQQRVVTGQHRSLPRLTQTLVELVGLSV
jgi:AcrR family transcriptional regulator